MIVTGICGVGGWKSFKKYQQFLGIVLIIIVSSCCIFGFKPVINESGLDSYTDKPDLPKDVQEITPGTTEESSSENGGTIRTVDEIEKEANLENKYLPILDIESFRNVFFTMSIESVPENRKEYEQILEVINNFTDIIELKEQIRGTYMSTYHTLNNTDALEVNRNPTVSAKIEEIRKIEEKMNLAKANNQPRLKYYNDLIDCYKKIVEIAPRGEFYLQLARPYEEKILIMGEETDKKKNSVFKCGANAVSSFRTASVYQGEIKETLPDLWYRIAKVYHYLGDMPGLDKTIRKYLYRISIAYLELAAEDEAQDDDYYGYISYYKAMAYHKLAVIDDDTGKKAVYLKQAKENYERADGQQEFSEQIELEFQHAIENVRYRLNLLETN